MGALNGTLSMRRYRIMGRPPEDFRDRYVRSVRAHALVPLDPEKNPKEDRAYGWCCIHDESDVDLDIGKFWLDGHICLGLRQDVLRPAPAEVKRELSRRKLEEEAKRKGPLPKSALRDLKEQVMAELRKRTAPQVRVVDVVWRVDEEIAYLFSQSAAQNELFLELFAKTFGLALDVEGPGAWAQELAMNEELEEELRALRPSAPMLGGFAGLRPGTRVMDELGRMDSN